MSKVIRGGIAAGLALVAGLCACSKQEKGGESDSFVLVPPPPPPAPGFFLTLRVTPQAVARLEGTHARIEVKAHYYDDSNTPDASHELGVETLEVTAAELEPLSPPGPAGSIFSAVITGKAVAAKSDLLTNGTAVVAAASVPDGSLICTTYNALLNTARQAPGEVSCDLASASDSSS